MTNSVTTTPRRQPFVKLTIISFESRMRILQALLDDMFRNNVARGDHMRYLDLLDVRLVFFVFYWFAGGYY